MRLGRAHRARIPPSLMADNPGLADIIEKNICTLLEVREDEERTKSLQDRLADRITAFSGSMGFLYVHVVWFGIWLSVNMGWLRYKPFDPYPFGLLTMIVSLEAIFLSTFVLISQNRMQLVADKRADLDLQINLLTEHEVTRLIQLVDAIADRMGISEAKDSEYDELKKDVAPEAVLHEIQRRAGEARVNHGHPSQLMDETKHHG